MKIHIQESKKDRNALQRSTEKNKSEVPEVNPFLIKRVSFCLRPLLRLVLRWWVLPVSARISMSENKIDEIAYQRSAI